MILTVFGREPSGRGRRRPPGQRVLSTGEDACEDESEDAGATGAGECDTGDDAGYDTGATRGAAGGDVTVIPTGSREPSGRGRQGPPGQRAHSTGEDVREDEGDDDGATEGATAGEGDDTGATGDATTAGGDVAVTPPGSVEPSDRRGPRITGSFNRGRRARGRGRVPPGVHCGVAS